VTTEPAVAQALAISDLARRTGLTPATLRAWETRHGFPVPTRRASGHRRYDERDVELVKEVLRRRDAGVRLEVAIADASASRAVLTSPTTSVFAELRRRHPHIAPQLLRKSTLLALTWAMEDECCARAQRPVLFAAFQQERFFRQAEPRWRELARTARSAVVFADFAGAPAPGAPAAGASAAGASAAGAHAAGAPAATAPAPGAPAPGALHEVHLPEEAPMRREWSLVCDAPEHVAALAAWELPGQSDVPDADRLFESVWTLEPRAVRDAARVCAQLADVLDPSAGHDWSDLEAVAPEPSDDLRAATSLFQRLVAYVDRGRR
jgi:MerR family transcriptional regulator, light-induced transcriptional regulator